MGKYRRFVMASLVGLTMQKLLAQDNFAKIERNVNFRANGLVHKLNASKDTLILKSDKKIRYVYSINKNYKREIDLYAGANEYEVPLNKLSKGKHVFVVVQSPLRIIFVIKVLKDHPKVLPVTEIKVTSVTPKD